MAVVWADLCYLGSIHFVGSTVERRYTIAGLDWTDLLRNYPSAHMRSECKVSILPAPAYMAGKERYQRPQCYLGIDLQESRAKLFLSWPSKRV
jgi:hypothetical protein